MATKAATAAAVTLDASDLASALKTVKPIVPGRTAIAALQHVRITADKDGDACVDATDVHNLVRAWLDEDTTTIKGGFDALLPFRDLEAFVKGQAGDVRMEQDRAEGVVRVQGPSRTATYPMGPADNWPTHFDLDARRALVVHAVGKELADVVKAAKVYASTDETRPLLCVFQFDPKAGRLNASNTYIAGSFALPGRLGKGEPINVPTRPLVAAMRGQGADTGVVIEADGQHAAIRVSGAVYLTRLVDGVFPKLASFAPEELASHYRMRVDQAALLDAVDGARSQISANGVLRVELCSTERIRLWCNTEDGGRFEEGVDVVAEADKAWRDAEAAAANGAPAHQYATKQKASEAAAKLEEDAPMLLGFAAAALGTKWKVTPRWPQVFGLNPHFLRDVAWSQVPDQDGRIELRFSTPLAPVSVVGEDGWAAQMPIRLNTLGPEA